MSLLDPPCPPAAAVSRETLPLGPSHRHRHVFAVCSQPAGHPRPQYPRHLWHNRWDIGAKSKVSVSPALICCCSSSVCPGATTAPSLIFILPGLFYIRIIPSDEEPMTSRPKIQVGSGLWTRSQQNQSFCTDLSLLGVSGCLFLSTGLHIHDHEPHIHRTRLDERREAKSWWPLKCPTPPPHPNPNPYSNSSPLLHPHFGGTVVINHMESPSLSPECEEETVFVPSPTYRLMFTTISHHSWCSSVELLNMLTTDMPQPPQAVTSWCNSNNERKLVKCLKLKKKNITCFF